MRVMVYAEVNNERMITVVPSRRVHLPPVTVRGRTKQAVLAEVAPIIDAVGREEHPGERGS